MFVWLYGLIVRVCVISNLSQGRPGAGLTGGSVDHVCVELAETSLLQMGAKFQECWEKRLGYQGPWKISIKS